MADDIPRMLGQIQGTVGAIDKKLDDLNGRLDHHSNRLGKLERWQATIAGAAAVAGVAVGAFFRKFFSGQ
jgi:ribosomal 50S subunit-associated protein YjgA (DUF615 family)